jgi:hypothetical protein
VSVSGMPFSARVETAPVMTCVSRSVTRALPGFGQIPNLVEALPVNVGVMSSRRSQCVNLSLA